MESKKEIVLEWRRQHPKGRRRDLYHSDLGVSKATVDRWWSESEVKERPLTAYETVRAWRLAHPEGTHAACVRETGLSRRSVDYHWLERNIPAVESRDIVDQPNIIEDEDGQLAFDF